MFTVCPKCALTLVVTAADLRIAQGYVRCGRCLNVFNALARLSEERPGAAAAPPPPDTSLAEAPDSEARENEAPAQPSEQSLNEDTGEIEVELDASMLLSPQRAAAAPQAAVDPKAPAAERRAAPPVPSSPQSPSTEPAASAALEPPDTPDTPAVPAATPPETNTTAPRADAAFELLESRSRAGIAWSLGAGALAIILALQIINHYRDTLVANPTLSSPLRSIYSALGVKLAPHWNIHAYDVRQLGASVAGASAGEIVVRASVKNAASRPQPLPLLRVTLQDRFGDRIAARDVLPRDYLPASVAPSSLLAAGGRVDATMVFVDPGPQAVGFEIDACLPIPAEPAPAGAGRGQAREVACAHGP